MTTQRTSARRSPARRTALVCTALAAATAVVATGCGLNDAEVRSATRSYTVGADGSTGKGDGGGVTVVDLHAHGGDVTVTAADPKRRTVGVTEDMEYDKAKPRTRHSVREGTLRLTADECGGNGDTCAVNYTVAVPAATDIRLRTGGGAITVRGTAGEVSARTGGGDIRMLASRAPRADLRTGGGGVSAAFAGAPSRVRCESGGGDVTVRLPRTAYAVDATSGGGEREVTVERDPDSPREVTARSGGGDVSVLAAS